MFYLVKVTFLSPPFALATSLYAKKEQIIQNYEKDKEEAKQRKNAALESIYGQQH